MAEDGCSDNDPSVLRSSPQTSNLKRRWTATPRH